MLSLSERGGTTFKREAVENFILISEKCLVASTKNIYSNASASSDAMRLKIAEFVFKFIWGYWKLRIVETGVRRYGTAVLACEITFHVGGGEEEGVKKTLLKESVILNTIILEYTANRNSVFCFIAPADSSIFTLDFLFSVKRIRVFLLVST